MTYMRGWYPFLIAFVISGCGKLVITAHTFVAPGALTIFPPSITMTAHSNASYPFNGVGGTPPYSYSVLSGPGAIDPALGVFTAGSSSGATVVKVRDAAGNSATATVATQNHFSNAGVAAAATDGSGNRYFVGGFSGIYPYAANGLIALNTADGSPNLSVDLKAGFNAAASGAVVLADGSIIVVGGFTNYQGVPTQHIAKIGPTGKLDLTFDVARTGFDSIVTAIVVSGNSVFLGGQFSTYEGAPAKGIAKLNASTGVLDTTFDAGGVGFNNLVVALAITGSNLYVSGLFTSYQGSAAPGISKLDTTTGIADPTFVGATFAGGGYAATLIASGTQLFAAGAFTTYGGAAASYIAKLNASTGALDTTFDPGGAGFDGSVQSIALSGTSLFVGGSFYNYRGIAAPGFFAKLDATTGSVDGTFVVGTGFDNVASQIYAQGADLYVGGQFSNYKGNYVGSLVKLDTTLGNINSSFQSSGPGLKGAPAYLIVAGTQLYVGCTGFYGGITARGIAKLLANGTVDPGFDTGGTGFNSGVNALIISGTSGFAGGSFSKYQNSSASGIAKFDLATGTLDTTFDGGGAGFSNSPGAAQIMALATVGSSLYVAGTFASYQGSTAASIAKLDLTTGTLDPAFDSGGSGFTGPYGAAGTQALAVSGTSLFVGGSFTMYQGATANAIAKLDLTTGNLDGTFDPGGGGFAGSPYGNQVMQLVVSGSTLYAGGSFITYRGTTANNIAKLDVVNGTLDPAFDVGGTGYSYGPYPYLAYVESLILSGSSLYVAGIFNYYQGTFIGGVTKIDSTTGALDPVFNANTEFNYSFIFSGATLGTDLFYYGQGSEVLDMATGLPSTNY